ncbi:hypothetical protein EMIHUDRAFT_200705 [Emiliania huxleyi CCMP1516]|uniref:Stress-associated endoplasmic reticulum protein n=2 Tax=Emiliania huxleyi TaxID=2903 RepID=A0A0D3KR01_EMIH1|nr:hypothetical protein EMIHUDRAFT_251926 [Emiliania huxleyi CCMP1516]XP_005790615.1 hypothetical protein EMIHUDRAFT_200705 [Emiliania huxleyi CCMP1516]EOD37762.1 hypothetical protein EMIHUDRAFT_251926 [Emiliania huxleyi CCMP1516]EOD38186.1 hypothetical protein EMIHUDRAFT_200705 [Emiliania huxleyi CCMP1516]|eukprot:XP_005790191.1 hypothetical protein EMIHUDRAFT_251926 [Emiliania huxleyi CCMP1516]
MNAASATHGRLVSAATAQRRRVSGDKKVAGNVTKRGQISNPSEEASAGDKLPVSKLLLGFFMFVIFGSTLLQLINKMAELSTSASGEREEL